MANAAVFMLIANDGRADQMIMATSLLHARIDDVRGIRMDMGHDDINPTLADIERTHLLFMNATFKPFAAFGFEYQKVQPTGSVSWGSTLKYSIPQAGDFFADIGVRFTCNAISGAAGAVVTPAADGKMIVGPGGESLNANGAAATVFPAVRWCDFPGERAVALGKFTVNSNTLHEYSQHATAFWRKYELPPGKEKSYARLVGQEVPLEGYSSVRNLMTQADATITDGLGLTGTTARVHRQVRSIVNGLQTPKLKHAATSFWHKCMFWFNRDPRLMVPSVSIPYGQRFVELTLSTQAQMCGAIGTDRAWILTANTHLPDELDLFTVAGTVTTATTAALDATNNGALITADMYVNNVYVLPDIHDIYIHRIGFNLIRVTREDTKDLLASVSNVQLHNLKWPIESIYFGCQPTAQENDLAHWWRMGQQTRNESFQASAKVVRQDGTATAIAADSYASVGVPDTTTWPDADLTPIIINGMAIIPATINSAAAATLPVVLPINDDGTVTVPVGCITTAAAVTYPDTVKTLTIAYGAVNQSQLQNAVAGLDHFRTCTDTLGDVTITLHGTKVYDAVPASFFSDYMPATFGCGRVVGTEDCGSHAVFFGFYPGTYQPSGHVNISRARELYFQTTPTAAGKLISIATAINFLLISDGNAILRYTT